MGNRLFNILRSIISLILIIIIFNITTLKAQTAIAPSGDGVIGDPYLIATLENLYWVTQNSSSWNKHFLQTANIDASSTIGWDSGAGFSPIGNGGTRFTGSYNGGGHTITGLYINRPSTNYIGFFGVANSPSSIKNIGLINVNVTGNHSVGGLVGLNYAGTISSSYSTGSVSGNINVGGLTGLNMGTITNSYSTSSVNGSNYVGGLVGTNRHPDGPGTITNSYSSGSVNSTGSRVGGLVGIGFLSVITDSFWDTQTSGQISSEGGTAKTTAEMKTAITYLGAGWDAAVWNLGDVINNGYPYLDWQNTSGTTLLAAAAPSGSGTVGDPYLIAILDNLYWVTQNSSSWNKHFLQTANIDASSTSGWDSGAGFSPIGNSGTRFTGSYDGGGHTITGLYINRPSTNYASLFGYILSSGTIKNLGLQNVNITGNDQVGGLIGYIQMGNVTNCYTSGTVTGRQTIGGFAGSMADNGNIYLSYSSAVVNASGNYSGGFIGNTGGEIHNSYAAGSVSGTSYVGGFAGSLSNQSQTSNVFSTGLVNGTGSYVGGIAGYASLEINIMLPAASITNSFWDTETSSLTTGIGGGVTGGTTGKTTAEMKTISTYINGGWDLEIETANGTDNIWDIDNTNGVINNGYPFLSWQNGGSVSISVPAPTVNIGAPSSSVTITGPVTFSITYSNAETVNLTAADVTLNKTGSADGTISVTNGTTSNPTITVNGITGDGTIGITISAGTSSNILGQPEDAGAGPSTTFLVDNTPPSSYSVSIDQPSINLSNQSSVSFTFTGAEVGTTYNYTISSSGVGTNVVGNGIITSTDQQITNIDLSGLTDGTITLSVTLTDVVGNIGIAETDTRIKDTVRPTANISTQEENVKKKVPFTVEINFNKPVIGFSAESIEITNGVLSNFTIVTFSQYTVDVMPLSSGVITIDIPSSTVQDGTGNDNTDSIQFSIIAVNNAPVIASIEEWVLNYTEMDEATPITNTLIVSDLDNDNLSSAVISITGNYTSGEDILSFTNQNGITGNWNNLTGTMTLTGNASIADYQTALRNIRYSNSSTNPNTLTRKVSFTINDGESNSNTTTRQINVIAVNNPPVVSFILSPLSLNKNESITFSLRTLLPFISDPDNLVEELVISFEYLGENLIITALNDSLIHIQPKNNWHGLDSIIIKVSDGHTTTRAAFAINIISVNDLPEFINLPEIVTITGSSPIALVIYNMVNDVETPNNLLQFEFRTGNDSLLYNFDPDKGLLILSALEGYKGETELIIKVTDEDGGVSETSITIKVESNITGIEELLSGIPTEYEVYQNYPNPFNPSTVIRYGLPEESRVVLRIFNILGQEVRTLFEGIRKAGYYEETFIGRGLSSGIYIYSLVGESTTSSKKYSQVKKMLMVK